MSQRTSPVGQYKAFDCGDDCHPDRYTAFTTRTWWGAKRWGVTDQHMSRRLTRICKDRLELHEWLVQLRSMELRERWVRQDRPGSSA